jgi:hypothetical protein
VLRGDILVLPVGHSFLYVESIYIQAETARMPQLRKVVLAMGNRLVYEDTFEQALQRLSGSSVMLTQAEPPPAPERPQSTPGDQRREPGLGQPQMRELATRLRQLRQQAEQLVKELEKVETELKE